MSFVEIIGIMREQGAVNNPTMPFLSKVINTTPIEISNGVFSLYGDDILVDSDITIAKNDTVLLIPVGDKFIVVSKVVSV